MTLKIGNKYAFSLIELLIVVCILSIVAGISLPLFSKTFDNILLKNSSQDIVYLMRLASYRAVCEGKDFRVYLDKNRNGYFLSQKEGRDYKLVSDRIGKFKAFSKKIKFDFDNEFIEFKPSGQTTAFKITLENNLGQSLSIINEGISLNAKITKA